MLPTFRGPVRWNLDALPDKDSVLPLLLHEAAEFGAVLGQPIIFEPSEPSCPTEFWDVVLDASAATASLTSDLAVRRLTLRIPDATEFMNGLNLLHSLAYSADTVVSNTESPTYATAFDRIYEEIANIYPSMRLRNLDWAAITDKYLYVRNLDGPDFWKHAHRWIAELGDAHTQLVEERPRFHPPYIAAMDESGATLLRVPEDSDGWRAGVRDGDGLLVESPEHWLKTAGASPQQRPLIAGRRFLAMATDTRDFTASPRASPSHGRRHADHARASEPPATRSAFRASPAIYRTL